MAGKRHLAVIGGGPGGLVVASVAGQLGLKVTLIEQSGALGGDCLHSGCVPSKSLLAMAARVQAARQGVQQGVLRSMPEIDFARAMDHVRNVIDHIQLHDDPDRFRGYGVDVRFGRAVFSGSHELLVNDEVIRAKRFLVATGTRPAVPPVAGLEAVGYETNETIFTCRDLPSRLAVIGAGPVGLELSQAFARLGSRVTVIEQADRLLPETDAGTASVLQQALQNEGITFRLGGRVAAARRDGEQRQLQLEDGSTVECDRILVASGRRPAVEGLGLEAAGIDHGPDGIRVDRRMRTSQRHVLAVGDVAATPYRFTHMAEYEAGIALANIVFRLPKKADYRVVPRVIYTDPEVAMVGLGEAEAAARGLRCRQAGFELSAVDRALTDDRTAGHARILVHRGRVAGATLIGAHAGELVHELALAMQVNAGVRHISALIHAYPTYAQVHRRAVNSLYAGLLQSRKARALAWLANRLLP